MKKILFVLSLALVSNLSLGNPVIPNQAFISEFQFDAGNNWKLEINFGFWGGYFLHDKFDSICVATSSGVARIRLDFVNDSTSLLVITSDSLSIPLSINSSGDCIKVYSYTSHVSPVYYEVDSLSFGNYPGSVVDTIPPGYSICRFRYNGGTPVYCLDKNPTIGLTKKDTSGIYGTLKGSIYNADGKKITSGNFELFDYPVYRQVALDGNGGYGISVFARRFSWSGILKVLGSSEYEPVSMDTLTIDAYPDSVIKTDIRFTELVGIREVQVPSNPELYIVNYPNPFNPSTNFYIRIPENLKRKNGRIDIYNSVGQRVYVVPISNGSSYKWDGVDMGGKPVASGVYYYRLVFDNTVYKTGSMILLK